MRSTGQRKGNLANPSTGQIGPTFRSDLRLSIPAVSLSAHTLNDAVCLQFVHEMRAGVLASLIGVEHQAGRRASMLARPLQGPDNQNRIRQQRERPADDTARIQVHHDRQIGPALKRSHVRNVARPHLIDRRRLEPALKQVGRHQRFTVSPAVTVRSSSRHGQLRLTHQRPRAVASDRMALVL